MLVVATSGHTPNHMSVIVRQNGISYFLAGDATYTEEALRERKVDGISPDQKKALNTLDKIRKYATRERIIYLPAHDTKSVKRMKDSTAFQI